ncbi:MAG: electron transfer flavoprotein subunit beta/FixA family protein [Chloroflexota bacterium]
MNIVVCVKQVPDTAAEKKLTASLTVDRKSVENILNPFDEYAVEEALRIKEKIGASVTALCVGPESAKEALRKAIAMGVEKAALVTDPAVAGSDAWSTAYVLAQALKKLQWDIALFGMQSTDSLTATVPGLVAEFLGLPQHSYVSKLEVSDSEVKSNRSTEQGYDVLVSKPPVVVSVTKAINEPRYPSLKGIMQAKKTEITVWSLADLGVSSSQVGAAGARTKLVSFSAAKARQAGELVQGLTPEEAAVCIADFLTKSKVI